MSNPLIQIRKLHIGFRKGERIDKVVHGVDLEIQANETIQSIYLGIE